MDAPLSARASGVAFAIEDAEEARLWSAYRDAPAARTRERLFSHYHPFAKQIARRHYLDRSGADIEFAELCQLACAGLLEALDRFDPDRGVPFRGYASRRITGSILDGLSKTSERREQLAFKKRIRSERARSLAEAPSAALSAPHDAMSALADLAVGLALGFMLEGTTLMVGDDQRDHGADAYETVAWKDTLRQIVAAVHGLPDPQQIVVRQHYFNGLDFSQIALLLALTRGRISQIHKAAMGMLRKRLPRPDRFMLER